MKRYEILFIVNADLPDEEVDRLIERYRSIITDLKGTIVKIEKWGKRKLAYEIKKQLSGFYILMDFVGKSAITTEIERNFKIDDKVLKFMTVKREDHADLEKIERETQEALQISKKAVEPVADNAGSSASRAPEEENKDSIPSETSQ